MFFFSFTKFINLSKICLSLSTSTSTILAFFRLSYQLNSIYRTPIYRSSHRRCSVRNGDLRNFAKFTGKHLCHSLLLNKVTGLSLETFLKKRLWHSCFPVSFAKFLRRPFLQNTYGQLLLHLCHENLFISPCSNFKLFQFQKVNETK